MQALKWGIVAISGLTGVLVGTQKLVSKNNSLPLKAQLTDLSKVSSENDSERPTTTNALELEQDSIFSPETIQKTFSSYENQELPSHIVPTTSETDAPPREIEKASTKESQDPKSEEESKQVELDSLSKIEPKLEETSSKTDPAQIDPAPDLSDSIIQETPKDSEEVSEATSNPKLTATEEFQLSGSPIIPEEIQTILKSISQDPEAPTDSDSQLPEEKPLEQVADVTEEITLPEVYRPKKLTDEEIKEQAKSAFEKLDDYTFKLFSPCNTGTGWILDYQLPEKGKSYPATWYIATSAHVIGKWYFDFSNPYRQILPATLSDYYKKWQNYYTNNYSKYYPLATYDNCYYRDYYGAFDIGLSKESSAKRLKSDWGLFSRGKIKRPRLFWTALNLFDKDTSSGIQDNNFKDFAVIEIEFTSEQVAKEITGGFAEKYTVDSNNAINIFSPALSKERLEKSEENFYSYGYPGIAGNKFGASKSWDESKLLGDKLADDKRKKSDKVKGDRAKGLVSTQSFAGTNIDWGKKKYERMGHFYFLKGIALGKGSSGSMSIDGEGNLLGLRCKAELGDKARFSMITPIRSDEIEVNGNFKTRKYDLIVGADGQKGSYKEQIEQYITSQGKETWLSKKGWR